MSIQVEVGKPFSPYKLFFGIFVPDCVIRYRGISLGAKLTLGRLYRYCRDATECSPPFDELCDELAIGETQARAYLSELRADGFIEIVRRGQGQTNLYRILGHRCYNGDRGKTRYAPPLNPFKAGRGEDQEPRDTEDQEPRDTEDQEPRDTEDLSYFKESLRESNTEYNDDPHPSVDQKDKPTSNIKITVDNICDVLHNSWQTVFGNQGNIRDTTGIADLAGEWIVPTEVTSTVQNYRDLGGKDDVMAFVHWKRTGELKQSKKNYSARRATQTGRHSNSGGWRDTQHPPRTETQRRPPAAQEQELEALIARWNELVPVRTAESNTSAYYAEGVKQALACKEFVDGFDRLCHRAAAIISARGDEVSWLTLRWLFNNKPGKPQNFWGVLSGELDQMAKEQQIRGRKSQEQERVEMTRRLAAEFRAKAQEEKKANGSK